MQQHESKLPMPLEAFFVIIASFFGSVVPQVIVFGFFASPEDVMPDSLGIKVGLVVGEIALFALVLIYLLKRNLPLKETFRLNPVPTSIMAIAIPVGISLVILVDEIDRLLQMIIPMPETLNKEIIQMMHADTPLEMVLIVLSAVVLAAVVEEAIFRGFFQQALEEHMDVTKGVIYASLAWAAIHANLYVTVQIFLFGFFLGWLAWRTNSIYPALFCHAFNNAIAVWYANSDHSGSIPVYEWGEHVSPVILIAALAVSYFGIREIDAFYRRFTPSSSNSIDSE